jgi:hypothetical protein
MIKDKHDSAALKLRGGEGGTLPWGEGKGGQNRTDGQSQFDVREVPSRAHSGWVLESINVANVGAIYKAHLLPNPKTNEHGLEAEVREMI